jgi:predicted amidohydrolase YtcJ
VDRPADLVLTNGRIVTLDEDRPAAQALAARDGEIVAIGTDEEVRRLAGPDTEVVDLDGRLAIPGFVEGHGHFTGLGRSLAIVDLRGARSWDEIVGRVEAAATGVPAGQWIVGRGWHQEKWDAPPPDAVHDYPVHHELSRRVADHPVVLTHASGHASIANARALDAAGIDAATPDPEGGAILRDAAGRATGVLRETAMGLVERARSAASEVADPDAEAALLRRDIELASRECLSKGITSFQDAGSSFATVDALRQAAEDGRLGVRLWIMLLEDDDALSRDGRRHVVRGAANEHFTVGGIKRYADGALGTHGAWLLAPYADDPSSTGHVVTPLDELETTAAIALDLGLQLCVHAIGDRANREVLDLFERATASVGDRRLLRWRIEHAQHLDPADVPRFAELGVVASVQTVHCTSDAPWVPERLGQVRARDGAYVWRSLLDAGATVTNGTDAPVEDVDPVANFHAAVTRRLPDGSTFHPGQRMTREEALRAATIGAAYAAFEEDRKGSLTPGKLADVVVLSEDILTVDEARIRDARVVMTIVGGEVRYRSQGP